LTEEAKDRQIEKAPDYAPKTDVLANYKATKGIWGILFRIENQLQTVKHFEQTEMIPRSDVREAVIDSINYLIGIYALIEEGGFSRDDDVGGGG
jgi:hypothetical protein